MTSKTPPREYVVLERFDTEFHYRGLWTATSARRAIDDARDGKGGRWAAIPTRNWNEEDLEIVEREPTVNRKRIHPGQTQIEVAA